MAGGAALGGAGAAATVTFVATPAIVNHQDSIDYTTKVGTMIYDEGCEKLTTEFDMKSNGTVVYTTQLHAKCVKMGWHMAPSKSSTSPVLLALPSILSTSTARSIWPRSRRNARSSVRAL